MTPLLLLSSLLATAKAGTISALGFEQYITH